jgi:autotransporter-associated beta strand protein
MKFNRSSLRAVVLGLLVAAGSVASAFAAIEADVALSYSPDAASRQGGEDNIQVNLANAIIGANSVHETSGTGVRWRIAGFYQSTANPVDQDNNYVLSLVNGDASFQDVRNFASSVGADLVSYYAHTTGSAGNAYQPGNYSTMGEQWIWYIVVAHELGHNYGCDHVDGRISPKTVMMHNYCGGGGQPYFSNPHMWLSGTQLIGDANSCLGYGLTYNGDNAKRVADSAQGKADIATRPTVGPNLNNVVLRWCFTNAAASAPASTSVADLVSGASAIVRGNGATFTSKGLRIPGTTTGNVAVNSMSAYIDLPNGIISSRTNITIEIWATPLSAPNWARLCDFGRPTQAGDGLGAAGEYTGTPGAAAPGATSASDDIMLSAAIGTDLTAQRFEAKLNGGASVTLDADLATVAGVPHHYAITFADGVGSYGAAGGRWQWYRDGDAIAYLDVNFHLADIEDVNNWLGRSMWSADNNANNEYAEVRLSNVTLARTEVLANYLLGPNFFPTASVTLTNSDAVGASSFNNIGQWSSGAAPNAGQTYETFNHTLRTPASVGSFAFGGASLKLTGGTLLYKGTASSTITVNNLTLDGAAVQHAGSGTFTLAGNITVTTNGGTINGVNGINTLSASLSGGGPLEFVGNSTTLAGNNSAFIGKWFIGNGAPGGVSISSPAQLGAGPASFASNHVTLNRGTLTTTATMTLNDANRGILIERGSGTFNVAAGTTLTLGNFYTPSITASLLGGALFKTGSGTLILSNTSSVFRGALYVDSGSTTANDGVLRIANSQTLLNAQTPIYIRNNNTGSSTLQLDGTTANVTITKSIAVNCRNNASAAIQNLAGTNTITGFVALNSGGNTFTILSSAGRLTFSGNHQYIGSLVGNRNYSFTGAGDHWLTGAILNSTNGSSIAVNKSGPGSLTLAGNNTYGGATTVSGGTLLVNGSISTGSVTVASSALLGGTGKILGPVSVQANGILAPGTSIGTLAISNALTLASGSTNLFEISKSGAVTSGDAIVGLSTLNYSGTLIVTNIGATPLTAGDSFKLFSAAVFNNTFTTVILPTLDAGLAWTNRLATDGMIAVVATVSTQPTSLGWNVSGNTLTLSWPADHVGWRLEEQTNNLLLGISLNPTDWATILGSSATNQIFVPLNPTNPAGFYRLTYP